MKRVGATIGGMLIIAVIIGIFFLNDSISLTTNNYKSTLDTVYITNDCQMLSNNGEPLFECTKGMHVSLLQVGRSDSKVSYNGVSGYIPNEYYSYIDNVCVDLCKGDGVGSSLVDQVNQSLDVIPEYYIDAFVNRGWELYCTSVDLNTKYYDGEYESVEGSTSYIDEVIYIQGNLKSAMDAPVHEFGHWFDWYNGYASQSDEFLYLYGKYGDNFADVFDLKIHWDERELFSESFSAYYLNRLELRENFPEIYKYMDDLVLEG